MQETTRKKLQLIVDKADQMAIWGFAEHLREKGLSSRLVWSVDHPESERVQATRSLPNQEQIASALLLIRFYTQANEGICLFRNDWIEPRANHRRPDWFSDPALSENWRQHFDDSQAFTNGFLSVHDPSHITTIDGRKVTRGMIFEAFAYGSALHSTEKAVALLDRMKQALFGLAGFEMEFCVIIMNIMIVIQRVAAVSNLELAGEPVPPVPR